MGSKAKKISIFAVQRGILPYTLFGILPKEVTIEANNPKEELFSLNPLDSEISDSLNCAIMKYRCLHDAILPRSLFSIESDFVEKNPMLVREYSDGDYFDSESEIKLFTNAKQVRVAEPDGISQTKRFSLQGLNT